MGELNAGAFEWNSSRLATLASHLAPAYLRVGGSASNSVPVRTIRTRTVIALTTAALRPCRRLRSLAAAPCAGRPRDRDNRDLRSHRAGGTRVYLFQHRWPRIERRRL